MKLRSDEVTELKYLGTTVSVDGGNGGRPEEQE